MPSKAVPISSVPVPAARPGMPTKLHDARRAFAKITSDTPRDEEAERAFFAAKIHIVRTHPRLDRYQRGSAYAELVEFVRVGVQLLFEELAPARRAPPDAGAPLH